MHGSPEARSMAVAAHLTPLIGFVVPFANVVAPALVLMSAHGQDPFVREHVYDELNFQVFWTVVSLVLLVATCGLGVVLLLPWIVFSFIWWAQALVAANEGREHEYPLTPRLFIAG